VISYLDARMVLDAVLTYAREQVLVGGLTAPAEGQIVPVTRPQPKDGPMRREDQVGAGRP
jgi:hypothetical protein